LGDLPLVSTRKGEGRRSRCSATPPMPGTRRSTPCPSAGVTAGSRQSWC